MEDSYTHGTFEANQWQAEMEIHPGDGLHLTHDGTDPPPANSTAMLITPHLHYLSYLNPSPQPTAQSPNDALMATMASIVILSGFPNSSFHKPTTSSRDFLQLKTHATVHDGHIVLNKLRGDKLQAVCKEPKRKRWPSQYFKDKALLMEAKRKEMCWMQKLEAFLADTWDGRPNAKAPMLAVAFHGQFVSLCNNSQVNGGTVPVNTAILASLANERHLETGQNSVERYGIPPLGIQLDGLQVEKRLEFEKKIAQTENLSEWQKKSEWNLTDLRSEPKTLPGPSTRTTQKPPVQQNKTPNVPVNLFTDCKLSDRKAGSKGISGQKDALLMILLFEIDTGPTRTSSRQIAVNSVWGIRMTAMPPGLRTAPTSEVASTVIETYGIPKDLRPLLPSSDLTMNKLSDDVVGIYVEQLEQGGMVTTFKVHCRSLRVSAIVSLFRVFYKLCKQGHKFSFKNKTEGCIKKCFKEITSSLKCWKKKFFLIDNRAIRDAMSWRHIDTDVRNHFPISYNEGDADRLAERVILLRKLPQRMLYMSGLTMIYQHPELSQILRDPEGKGNNSNMIFLRLAFVILLMLFSPSSLFVFCRSYYGQILGASQLDRNRCEHILKNQGPPNRTTAPLPPGSAIPLKNLLQKNVEDPNPKIAEARKKKEKQAAAKAKAKRDGEAGTFAAKRKKARKNTGPLQSGFEKIISITPIQKSFEPPNRRTEGVESQQKKVETSVVDLTHSYHSQHAEDDDEDTDGHRFILEWGLRNDLRIRSCTIEIAITAWITAPPLLSSGSSSKYSSAAPSYARPSRRRSRYVSTSLKTSHLTSSSPPPHKRPRVLIYSSSSSASLSPSPSVGPSRKRCRLPTLLLPATAMIVSTPPIEMLPPSKRFRGTSSAPQEDTHAETTIEARLDDHSKMLGEIVVATEQQCAALQAKAKATEQQDMFSRDKILDLERRLGYVEYLIQESEVTKVTDRLRIRRIERCLGM
ncbi:hypothetical protein Tco_1394202 [Tanacetum coccineum]